MEYFPFILKDRYFPGHRQPFFLELCAGRRPRAIVWIPNVIKLHSRVSEKQPNRTSVSEHFLLNVIALTGWPLRGPGYQYLGNGAWVWLMAAACLSSGFPCTLMWIWRKVVLLYSCSLADRKGGLYSYSGGVLEGILWETRGQLLAKLGINQCILSSIAYAAKSASIR